MKQMTFAEADYAGKLKQTRKAKQRCGSKSKHGKVAHVRSLLIA